MNERIKKLRKSLDLTQKAFAEHLGMKQNSIAQIEMGRSTSDQTIRIICKEFGVREEWLRTGAGEMFNRVSKEDELSAAVHKLLSNETSEFKTRLIKILADLGSEEWDILEKYALKLVQDKPAQTMTIEQEARAKADEYYREILAEKKAAERLSASSELQESNKEGVG